MNDKILSKITSLDHLKCLLPFLYKQHAGDQDSFLAEALQKAQSFDPSVSRAELESWVGLKAAGATVSSPSAPPLNLRETLNDAGNADRFITKFGTVLRYVVELKYWMIWYHGEWRFDKKGNVLQLALKAAREIYKEAAAQTDAALAQALSAHASRSLQQPRLEAMVTIAATNPKVAVSVSELDADAWLMQVRGGVVVDLRTGVARDSKPEDLITQVANVTYDQGADCHIWKATVDGCFAGNRDMVDFYQRAIGYTATGSTKEQVFFFQYGTGANGKSTLINAIREIFAGYSAQINPEVLMVQRGGNAGNATPELARLKNVRLAAATETEDGQRLAEAFIKQATGGEPIVARELYGSPFEYVPAFKLWLSGNHRPIVRGEDHGIWRRIILIYFGVTIPPDARDKNLPDKLRAEYPGILNWIIEGALLWMKHGLNPPQEIAKEVEDYKSDMDLLQQWMGERCSVSATADYSARAAYVDFANWCRGGGHQPVSEVRFAQKMTERGIEKRKSNAGSRYLGIAPRQGLLAA